MGLDMYLKATGPRYKEIKELADARAAEFLKWGEDLVEREFSRLKELPKTAGYIDREKLTKEDRDFIAGYFKTLIRKAHSLGGILTRQATFMFLAPAEASVREIGYWRKEWDLHKYIISHWGDKDGDNLREVYLDEDAIKAIIEAYKDDGGYVSDSFRTALDIVRGGGVVFYLAWY